MTLALEFVSTLDYGSYPQQVSKSFWSTAITIPLPLITSADENCLTECSSFPPAKSLHMPSLCVTALKSPWQALVIEIKLKLKTSLNSFIQYLVKQSLVSCTQTSVASVSMATMRLAHPPTCKCHPLTIGHSGISTIAKCTKRPRDIGPTPATCKVAAPRQQSVEQKVFS